MDFTLTDEQRILQDMVERLADEKNGPGARRAATADSCGFNQGLWSELAHLGVLGAALPEHCGGLEAGPVATTLIMSALGKHLVLSPYIPTVVCTAALLARAGTDEQRRQYLPPLLAGEAVFAFGCTEGSEDEGTEELETVARETADGYEIEGRKSLVIGAEWSRHLVVVARMDSQVTADGRAVVGAFIVPIDAAGTEARHYRTIDGGSASEIGLRKLRVPAASRIGGAHDLGDALGRIRDEAIVAHCAEAAGSMEAVLHATVQYARTRKQFGKPIGSFQALRHRMVDMLLASEQAAAITHRAALTLDDALQPRRRAASAAKSLVGRHGRFVMQAAIQIHGGIGTTEELDVSHHFRRIEMFNLQLGTIDHHVRRYADLLDHA